MKARSRVTDGPPVRRLVRHSATRGGGSLGGGGTIQSKPNCCPTCDSRRIIKRGVRKNRFRHLQIYWCKDCRGYFSSLEGLKGVKYPPRLIARALCLYNLGHSQEETARRIASEHRITVPRRTLSDWIRDYRSITTFHRLRAASIREFGHAMLAERTLHHQQVYQYKIHRAKLQLMEQLVPPAVAAKVRTYLLGILDDFPDVLFEDDARSSNMDLSAVDDDGARAFRPERRSSKARLDMLPLSRREKQNLANDLAALGLLLARRKLYALAFASRTRLPLKALKCAWFDEHDYFEFFPLQAVKARS